MNRPATRRPGGARSGPLLPDEPATAPPAAARRVTRLPALLLLALVALSAAPARAQTADYLSNTAAATQVSNAQVVAQGFTTGTRTGGYPLHSVGLSFSADHSSTGTFSVGVYTNGAGGRPGTRVAVLTNPSSIPSGQVSWFTAPAGATLNAGTKYWVVVNSSAPSYIGTNAGNKVAVETGWRLNNRVFKLTASDSWTTSDTKALLVVRGAVNAQSDTRSVTQTRSTTQADVSTDWDLKPSAVAANGRFRLLFATSTTRNASSTDIADYNTFVQTRAAAGHSAIQSYSSGFRVVGCTASVDARDNTATTYTSSDKGVPIYWLNGAQLADDYEDFYDNSWDSVAAKNESGSARNISTNGNFPFTGCASNGTEKIVSGSSRALGASSVRLGDHSFGGPIDGNLNLGNTSTGPFYALSQVFRVTDTTAPTLSGATVDGATLTLTFSENLAAAANLANSAFSVTKGSGNDAVALASSPSISGATVVLTLGTALTSADTNVKVDYDKPDTDNNNRLEDAAGNEVADFTDETVTNNTAAVNNAPTVETAIPNQLATTGTLFSYQFPDTTFADADTGDTLTYTATKSDDTTLPTWLTFSASTRTFSGTPAASDAGILAVKVTATDSGTGNLSVSDTFDIEVLLAAPAQADVAENWALKPSGLVHGDTFRLLFVTSTRHGGQSSDIADYNTFVRTRAAAGHAAIRTHSSGFRVVGCTATVDARDNTATTYTSSDKGVPIYWLNGAKAVDDYEDFYDGSWDSVAGRNEAGGDNSFSTSNLPWTGCRANGTEDPGYALGSSRVTGARPDDGSPLTSDSAANSAGAHFFYALSQVFRVTDTTAPTLSGATVDGATLTLTFSENLAAAANLANSAFSVTKGSGNDAVALAGTPSISGATVVLTLGAALTAADTNVKVDYDKPDTDNNNRLEDAAGNEVADFTDETVTNNTAAVNNAPTVANAIPNQLATTGTLFSYQFPDTTFADADTGDTLTYTATKSDGTALPTWLTFTASSRTFSGTPAASDAGILAVKVTATDSGTGNLSVSDTFDIEVLLAAPPRADVAEGWALKPSGLVHGDTFRLLFATSNTRNATSKDIADYNSFVQGRAAAGHAAIRTHSSGFRVVGCTASVHARDNTATRYTNTDRGAPIYWLDGDKLADDYRDFYDGSWDSRAGKNESGGNRRLSEGNDLPNTGCRANGTKDSGYTLGSSEVALGTPIGSNLAAPKTSHGPFYGLSQLFRVVDVTTPTFSSAALDGATLTLTYNEPLDANSVPAASAFTVKVAGSAVDLADTNPVTISGIMVTLTLASAVASGQTVTVSYTKPSSNPLQDAAGNAVTNLVDQAVSNRASNAAPTAANRAVTTDEDTVHTFTAADFGFQDTDTNDALVSVKVTALEGVGDLRLNDLHVTLNQVIPKTDIDAGRLTFTPVAGAFGAPYDTFGFKVSDGLAESAAAYTLTVNVTQVLELTAFGITSSPAHWTIVTGRSDANRREVYGVGDVIEFTATFDAAVTVTGDPHLVFSLSGDKNAPYDAARSTDAGTGKVVFAYTVQATDTDNDGIFVYQSTDTNFIELDSNDKIVATDDATVNADLTWPRGRGRKSGHKVDGTRTDPPPVSLAVTSTAPLSGNEYGAGDVFELTLTMSAAVTVTGTPHVQIHIGPNIRGAQYAAAASTSTALVFRYTVVAADTDTNGIFVHDGRDIPGSNSGVVLEAGESIRAQGTSTDADLVHPGRGQKNNHKVKGSRAGGNPDTVAPTFSSATADGATLTITFNEVLAAAANLANSAFSVTKGSGNDPVTLAGAPSISGATVVLTLGAALTSADTNVKVDYTKPDTDNNNRLEDAAGNEVADFTDKTVTNNTAAVNTAPTVSGTPAVTTNEDTEYTFAASDFNFSDTDADDTLSSVKITSLPANGTLEEDGTAIPSTALPKTVAATDIGDLTFDPAANANGAPYTTFKFKVNDGEADSPEATMTVNVTAVNDAPTVANEIPNQSATTNTAFNYTVPANTFADVDDDTLTYTAVEDGETSLPSWLTFTASTPAFSGTPTATGTVSVKVTATDTGPLSVSDTFDITVASGDTTAPTVASIVRQTPSASPTNADSLTWRVTFSEAVENVGTADFAVTGTTATVTAASAVSGTPGAYDVTVSGGNLAALNATVTLSFAATQDIEDAADNDLSNTTPTGTNHNTFVVDNTAPTVTSIVRQTPSASPTNADSLVWRVTFSEAVKNVGTADFAVSGTTATVTAASAVSGTPGAYDVTVSGGNLAALNATVTLSVKTGHDIEDTAGNDLTATAPTGANHNTFVVDNTAPTLSGATADGATLTLTFSETLAAAADLANSAFSVTKGSGNSAVTLTGTPTLSGATVGLTPGTALTSADTNVKVDYDKPDTGNNNKLKDAAGNEVADFTDETVTNNTAAVNTAPTVSGTPAVTTNEDTAHTFAAANFNFSDTDGNTLSSVKITALPANGTLKLDGTAIPSTPLPKTVSAADITANKLTFEPAANANGTPYTTFKFKVNDGTADSAEATMTVNVTAVNDAPTVTGTPAVTTNEDTAHTFTAANFNFSDTDGNTLSSVKITALPANGTLKLDGTAIPSTPLPKTVSAADITANKLTFEPAADANGTPYTTFKFKVNDGTADSAEATMTINVTAVNDAPTVSGTPAVTTNEDTAHTFTAANFNFADTDGNTLSSVKITALPANGTLKLDGTAIPSTPLPKTVSAADITANKLTFEPAANANGTPYTTFKFKVNDGTADSAEATMTVNVTAVNDAPTVTGTPAVTTNEDTAHTFTAANFNFSDTDGNTLSSVKITALPANGTLKLDGTAIPSTPLPKTVSAADITANKLTFEPAANANGTPYTTFKFKVNDGTADSAEATMTINVTAVNDAPTVSGTPAVTTNEDTAHTFTAANFNFSDTDGNTLSSVKITALPANGTLKLDGTAIPSTPLPKTVSAADITANKLTFEPAANANGTPYTTFKFKVNDGTADSAEATMTINVTAVNDAPTVSGTPAVTTNEDTAHTFTAANFNFADTDGNTLSSVKITALPANGTLKLDGTAIPAGDVPKTVAAADIGDLTFEPVADANGTPYTTFKFKVNDGTADSAEATMTVNVTAVNDAPTVTGTPAVTTNEDTAHTFTAANFNFSDTDGNALSSVKITALPALGTLKLDGTAIPAGDVPKTVAAADIGDLTFEPVADANGTPYTTFKFKVNDGAADSAEATMTINVTAVNDAPTVANEIPNQAATAGTRFVFAVHASTFHDEETLASLLTYTAAQADDSVLPGWLTFTAGSVTFSGTPASADLGTVSVKVTASDGALSVSDTFDITVSADPDSTAPTVATVIPDQSATVGEAFGYRFPEGTFDDTDNDTLIYTASKSDGTDLPGWLSFDAAGRFFSGTPASSDVGTLSVKVTADDGRGGTVSDTFDIVVSAAVDPPPPPGTPGVTLSATALSVAEGGTGSYTVVLAARPADRVEIMPASDDPNKARVSAAHLVFTPADWDTPQRVTVTGVRDGDMDDETVRISHSVSERGGGAYATVTAPDITVTVNDNDTAERPDTGAAEPTGAPPAPSGLRATGSIWRSGDILGGEVVLRWTPPDAPWHTSPPLGRHELRVRPRPDGESGWSDWMHVGNGGEETLRYATGWPLAPATGYTLELRAVGYVDGEERAGPSTQVRVRTPAVPALSVADTSVTEGPGAALAFRLRLDQAAPAAVSVNYETWGRSASAGSDYTDVSGTVTFTPGQREKTVSVTVLDDNVDEGEETLVLSLSNLRGPARLDNYEAVGTIRNHDPLPQAWLARFGRTAAAQVSDLLGERFEAAARTDNQLTLGGRVVDKASLDRLAPWQTQPADRDHAPPETGGPGHLAPRDTGEQGNPTPGPAGAPDKAGDRGNVTADLAGGREEWGGQSKNSGEFLTLTPAACADTGAAPSGQPGQETAPSAQSCAGQPVPSGEATLIERALWTLLTQRGRVQFDERQFLSQSSFNLSLSDLSFPRRRESSGIMSRPAGDTVSHWMPGQARHDGEGASGTVPHRMPGQARHDGEGASGTVPHWMPGQARHDGEGASGTVPHRMPGQARHDGERAGGTASHWMPGQARHDGEGAGGTASHWMPGQARHDGEGAGGTASHWMPGQARHDGEGAGDTASHRMPDQARHDGERAGGTVPHWVPDQARHDGEADSSFPRRRESSETTGRASDSLFKGRWSLWGRGSLSHFSGEDTGVSLSGDVLTGLIGLDYARQRWLAGVALAYHDGDGTYTSARNGDAGDLDSTLVTVNPYLRYALTERLSVWGTAGYGAGSLSLRRESRGQSKNSDEFLTLTPGMTPSVPTGQPTGERIETDLGLAMGAVGLRGVVYAGAATELALKADALWARTTSKATNGMQGAAADTGRIRLLLSGQHGRLLANDALLSPSFELGLRYDEGDAETGFGLELGGGLQYADSLRGLSVETKARALVAHEDGGYEEWGLSGSLSLDPGRLGRGLALRLDSGWGAAESHAEALWQRQTTAGLAPQQGWRAQGRFGAEAAYGLDVPWTYGILTPYAGVEWAGQSRALRLGWRFELGQQLSLSLDAERRADAHAPAEYGVMLNAGLPW